jgi:hypothetical protein
MLGIAGRDSDSEPEDDLEAADFEQIIQPQEVDQEKKRQLIEAQRREDEEYEGEWGYGLMKSLRGKTVGRRLRRKLFKYGCIQLISGFALLVIVCLEDDNFQNNSYFDNPKFGASLMVSSFYLVKAPKAYYTIV